jgi:ABC-type sugar transport system substrate-binding protein
MRGIIGAALLATAALCMAEPAHSEGDRAKAAAERLQPYRDLPKFSAAGPAFDARTCMKGKSILGIPVSSANPFTKNIYIAMTNAAKKVGFTFREWENQGRRNGSKVWTMQQTTNSISLICSVAPTQKFSPLKCRRPLARV